MSEKIDVNRQCLKLLHDQVVKTTPELSRPPELREALREAGAKLDADERKRAERGD